MKLTNLHEEQFRAVKDLPGYPYPDVFIGSFHRSGYSLTSLEGSPAKTIEGSFDCSRNKLVSLKGAPREIFDWFDCSHNILTSLEFAPSKIEGSFDCENNRISSLIGIDDIFEELNDGLYCSRNPIREGGLGVLLIEGLTYFGCHEHKALELISTYVGQQDAIYDCQVELIEKGFEAYAQL